MRKQIFAVAFSILLFAPLVFSQTYSVERAYAPYVIYDNPENYEAGAAINNKGQMVGRTYNDIGPNGTYNSFTYYPSQLLGNPPIAENGARVVMDINDRSLKVGVFYYAEGEQPIPCFWPSNSSTAYLLRFPGGYVYGLMGGVNNRSQMVGTAFGSPDPEDPSYNYPPKAFIWDTVNGVRFLENFGVPGSLALSINDNGTILGTSGDEHLFIWDAQNGTRSLNSVIGSNNGWTYVRASKINNNGQILGIGRFQGGAFRHFFWDGSSVHDLGPRDDLEIEKGLNDLGDIVGWNRYTQAGSRAFIWNVNDGMRYIDDIAPEDEWVWQSATDINNKGQILVNGYNEELNMYRAHILSPVKEKTPLIFIPGIGGSTLHEADGNGNPTENLWADGVKEVPFISGKLDKLSLNPDDAPFTRVVPVDALRNVSIPFKTFDFYGEFLENLEEAGDYKASVGCSQQNSGEKPNLFIFPYDWRFSNIHSAQKLKELIQCINQLHPGKKVDILTHSMGGLLARRYIIDNPNTHGINKMISTVAPWLGAPKSIDVLFTGKFLKLGWRSDSVKNIVQFGEGSHELLPSAAYFVNAGSPFALRSPFTFTRNYEVYAYSQTYEYINYLFSSQPYVNNADFHQPPLAQDNWSSDVTGIKYYHLYSETWDEKTIGQVRFAPSILYPLNINKFTYEIDSEKTTGDGTVPVKSAERTSNMLAPGTVMIPYRSPSKDQDDLYDHEGVLGNDQLRTDVIDILNDNYTPQLPSDKNSSEKLINTETENLTTINSTAYLSVTGVDRLDISDNVGNTNSPTGLIDNPVPDVNYERGSEVGEALVIPHEASFPINKSIDVKFLVTGEKINIENIKGSNRRNAIETIKYLDLQLPIGVTAWLKFNLYSVGDTTRTSDGTLKPESDLPWVENLRYDADGDGTFETEVLPTFTLTGDAANDKTPPSINISYALNGGQMIVSANASDDETGIKQIRYIVSGENTDRIYTSPFIVDQLQSQLIYVSAEDNAGNRSLLAKWLDNAAPTTNINQTPPSNSAGWNTSNVTLELKGMDGLGGAGIKTLTYSGSGAQSIAEEVLSSNETPLTFPQPSTLANFLSKTLNVYAEGVTELTFFSRDRAGNTEAAKTYSVKIDRGLPITHCTTTVSNQQTMFTMVSTDAISGVGEVLYSIDGGTAQVYTAPFSVSNIGGHYITYYAKDVAGNEENPQTVYINPAQTTKSVLISEFRTRGHLGTDDEFIELYNNGETAVNIGGWTINVKIGSAATPTTLATINAGTVIPPRGHFLLRKAGTNNYSLSGYAEADQTYMGALGDNSGIALISSSSLIIDAVGFSSVTDASYREGAGIVPSTGITANGQYSFVRNYTRGGVLIDSNNNRADFIFVATDGGTYNNLKALVGSPGPENLNSPIYKGGNVLITQIDDKVTLAESPNRFYDYTATSPQYPVGVLSVRRKLTNNTGNVLNTLRIRITAVTTKNSATIFSQQAVLRLINSSDITVISTDGLRTFPLKGLTVESIPATIDGGFNSSLTFNLGTSGLANGESLNVNLKSGIVSNGQYKLEFRVEAKP